MILKNKKESKGILFNFILLFVIFSFLNLIYINAQTNSFPVGGDAGSGVQSTGTTPESQTKTGVENPPEKGTVGNEKQDLGGLVGLENKDGETSGTDTVTDSSNSQPSLSGQNLDFKRDIDTKAGTQKTEITPNDKLGESKLELNGNEFSAQEPKDGKGDLGKSKFVIEKKDGEQFAEAGAETEYKVEGRENEKGNAVDELSGREIELSKDTQVKITESAEGKRQVEMTVPKGGEIHQPEERKNGKEEEGKETDYRWFGQGLKWDSGGETHIINGELAWNQKLGFYLPVGNHVSVDGVDIFTTNGRGNNFDVQLFSDGNAHPEALGSYASFGKDTLFTGSNNKDYGPYLQFTGENKYGINIDSQTDRFLMQAYPGGQISLTNRASSGLSPNLELIGNGGWINNGDKYYQSDGIRFDTKPMPGSEGRTSSIVEITPKGADGNSLIGNNRYVINNGNQGAQVSNNWNFDTQGPYKYEGNSFDPRIGNNLINSPPSKSQNIQPQNQPNSPSPNLPNPSVNNPPLTNPNIQPPTQQNQPQIQQPKQNLKEQWGKNFRAIEYAQNDKELGGTYNPSKHNNGVLLKFGAYWCPHCVQMTPEFEALSKQRTDIKFSEVNVDTEAGKSLMQQYHITGVPALIYLKNGQVQNSEKGYLDKNQINEFINEIKK